MPAIADILLFRTTGSSDPPLLYAGELAVTAAPANVGKVWIGDGTANRLLLSTNPADLPLATANYLPLQGGTLTGAITLPTGYSPTDNLHVATKGYVDTRDALYLPLTGGTLNGNLTMGAGRTLTLAGNATANAHAVPLQQVNSLLSGYLPLGGGEISGMLTVTSGLMLLAGPANILIGGSMTTPRWMLQLGDGTPETGGDVGNNLVLQAWNDAGLIVPVFDITRDRRWVSSYPLTLRTGTSLVDSNIYGESSSLLRWSISPGTDGADADANFYIGRYDDTGAKISNALTINRQTGALTTGGSITLPSGYSPTADLQVATKQYADSIFPEAPTDGRVYCRNGATEDWVAAMPSGGGTFTGAIAANMSLPVSPAPTAGQVFASNNFVLAGTGGICWNWYGPTTYLANGVAARINLASSNLQIVYATSGAAGTNIDAAVQTTPFQFLLNAGELRLNTIAATGGASFAGAVQLPAAAPTGATHATHKSYVDSAIAASVGAPAGITFSFIGTPLAGGRIVVPITSNITLPANLVGTVSACGNNPTANSSYLLQRTTVAGVTTTIATIVLNTSGGVEPLTMTAVNVAAGEALSLVAPAVADATAADVGITVAGVRR